MKVHEYQAKDLLRRNGVPVPSGGVATTPDEARAMAERIGCPCAVKAQIHAGGRGKGLLQGASPLPSRRKGAGRGVQVARTPVEAYDAACEILGTVLVTAQTGEKGRLVRRVLVEGAVTVEHEYYLALVVDREAGRFSFVASSEGGMDIEIVSRERPQAIVKVPVDPCLGYRPFLARRLASGLQIRGKARQKAFGDVVAGMWRLSEGFDASQVEINPLVSTPEGRFVALDGKLTFDDGALPRQKDVAALRDPEEEDPVEAEASALGLSYVELDGTVGCMVNGAGLAMATMDIILDRGVKPANFLDVGGGARAETVEAAFRLILRDPDVEVILVNIFGGIVRCDLVARGILEAAEALRPRVPLVIRLSGTRSEEGSRLLAESGLDFVVARSFAEAADKVAEIVARGRIDVEEGERR